MGQGYLMDTNAAIDYCGGKMPTVAMQKMHQIADNGFNISPIVKIEALGFDSRTLICKSWNNYFNSLTYFILMTR